MDSSSSHANFGYPKKSPQPRIPIIPSKEEFSSGRFCLQCYEFDYKDYLQDHIIDDDEEYMVDSDNMSEYEDPDRESPWDPRDYMDEDDDYDVCNNMNYDMDDSHNSPIPVPLSNSKMSCTDQNFSDSDEEFFSIYEVPEESNEPVHYLKPVPQKSKSKEKEIYEKDFFFENKYSAHFKVRKSRTYSDLFI